MADYAWPAPDDRKLIGTRRCAFQSVREGSVHDGRKPTWHVVCGHSPLPIRAREDRKHRHQSRRQEPGL